LIRRKKIGFVFQQFNLINVFTALENVEMPMRIANMNKEKARKIWMRDWSTGADNRFTGKYAPKWKATERIGRKKPRSLGRRAIAGDKRLLVHQLLVYLFLQFLNAKIWHIGRNIKMVYKLSTDGAEKINMIYPLASS